jgi:hypothetical protein
VIGDRQRIAVLAVAEQELAFVIRAPELIGALPLRESCSLRTPPGTTTAFDKAVAIEHRMDRAFGRNRNTGKSGDQALADFASTPVGVLMLQFCGQAMTSTCL